VYIVIKAINGTTLMEGHAPLTFTGTIGSTYTITVPVLGNMEFDRWDNGVIDRTRSITLNRDNNTVTAYLEVDSPTTNTTIDSRDIIIRRFADVVDQDNCFDSEDAQRLNMVIGGILHNIYSENEGGNNQLQQKIDSLVQDCTAVAASAGQASPDSASPSTAPSETSGDGDGGGDESTGDGDGGGDESTGDGDGGGDESTGDGDGGGDEEGG